MGMSEPTEEKAECREDFAALILDRRGMILECNQAAERLFGYSASELIWRPVSVLLPQLEEGILVRDGNINPKLKFMCRCGQLFMALDRQCRTFQSELHLVELRGATVRAILCPAMS
jgi:PAS domain-containing protein